MRTICQTSKYLSMIVIVFLAISISMAENGVILNPRTIQLVIPSISQANEITQYPKILFLISSESVRVKKIMEQLYKKINGWFHTYSTALNNECLPSASRTTSSTIARIRQMKTAEWWKFLSLSFITYILPHKQLFLFCKFLNYSF